MSRGVSYRCRGTVREIFLCPPRRGSRGERLGILSRSCIALEFDETLRGRTFVGVAADVFWRASVRCRGTARKSCDERATFASELCSIDRPPGSSPFPPAKRTRQILKPAFVSADRVTLSLINVISARVTLNGTIFLRDTTLGRPRGAKQSDKWYKAVSCRTVVRAAIAATHDETQKREVIQSCA